MTSARPDSSVERLYEAFDSPDPAAWGPVPIWWWSGAALDGARLRWQMERLLEQGVAQAVIMNLAPTGPLYGALADDPPFMTEAWWTIFLAACEDAAELGFRFWPYDQIGFSGANFQGRLVTEHPEWAGHALGRVEVAVQDGHAQATVPHGAVPLAAYVVGGGETGSDGDSTGSARWTASVPVTAAGASYSGSAQRLVLVYEQETGFDYFSAPAFARLMDTVHGEFERRAKRFFGSVIVGFFQDELPNMPTWGRTFAATFAASRGYDLTENLGALWGDPVPAPPAGVDQEVFGRRVRLDYHRHRAALARAATFEPMARWFDDHGLQVGFDQQSPAREGDPSGSVVLYGDYLATHAAYTAPGSDHLGDPKVHSSLAHLHGGSRTWIEAFHSSGWGGTLEETYDWLAPFLRRGATLYDPHAVYYSTVGGWWEWAPPSTCWRQPYWSEYGIFSRAVTRLSALLAAGTLVCETALVFPTTDAQATTGLDDSLRTAWNRGAAYHALNGSTAWSAERPGVLDRARVEYEIVDDVLLGSAALDGDALAIGNQRFRAVVVPDVASLDGGAADRLAGLARAGGVVVVVGAVPDFFPGSADDGRAFLDAVASGAVVTVADAEQVPACLVPATVRAEASAPTLLHRIDDGWLLAAFAHDGETGTDQPILRGSEGYLDWIESSWDSFWNELAARGYTHRPVGDRPLRVVLHGVDVDSVEQWSPVTGRRVSVPFRRRGEAIEVDTAFDDGTTAVLVFGTGSTAPARPTRSVVSEHLVTGFTATARSLLDNRWGDFAAAERAGVLPIEVWRLEAATGDDPADWTPVVATFGPFAEVAGPAQDLARELARDPASADWRPAEWSLSRGIFKDSAHGDSLGPKGYVPEEFLHFAPVEAGESMAVRTTLDVPHDGLVLVVGANAQVDVDVDGAPARVEGEGYWHSAPVEAGRRRVTVVLEADRTGPVRASFALVADPERYRRAEWLEPVDGSVAASTVTLSTRLEIAEITDVPADARIQVGAEQPTTVVVNGTEIARQNAFDPYGARRFGRLHPYDLGPHLTAGTNLLELRSTDAARPPAFLVDSRPASRGGLGLTTGRGEWSGERDTESVTVRPRPLQWGDPRFSQLVARPHPLPRAAWLEQPEDDRGVVVDVVPDIDPDDDGPRWLRAPLPVGTTRVTVCTALAVTATVDGRAVAVGQSGSGGVIDLPHPSGAGALLALRFSGAGGRRGGALLDEPLRVETTTAQIEVLADWSDLGLGSLAGEVVYRTSVVPPRLAPGERLELDLGAVRGSVRVTANGTEVGAFAWGPYRVDLTREAASSSIEVEVSVHNTLAGYFTLSSPTPGVFPNQLRAGLRGPVRLVVVTDEPSP